MKPESGKNKEPKIDFNSEQNEFNISKKELHKVIKTKGKSEAEIKANVIGFVMNHPKKLIFILVYSVACGVGLNIKWIINLINYFL